MYKVLIATKSPFKEEARNGAVNILKEAGFEVKLLEKYTEKSQLIEAIKEVNAVIVRSDKIDQEIIENAPNLKLVIRAGSGYNNIDVNTCTQRNIIVMNTPGQNSNAVAELVFGMLLALLRNIPLADYSTKRGEFLKSKCSGRELKGKRIGIHGFGYIGQIVASIARGFGMEVVAYDPWVSQNIAREKGAVLVEKVEDIYKNSDFVSLHIPKTKATENIVNYQLLSLMKEDGILINAARAEVVNHDDLCRIMDERPLFKYGADVHPEGDTPGEKRMAKYGDRVLLTPHIGASTFEANKNCALAAAKQCVDFFVYGKISAAVNKDTVPYWLQHYADLANILGYLSANLVKGQPRELQIICYGELEPYTRAFTGNVLKGLLKDIPKEITPYEAISIAQENKIRLITDIKPDNTRGHGNSITVDYVVEDNGTLKKTSVRGTISEGFLKISRIEEFKNVDFVPAGTVCLFQYYEKEGMMDAIGEFFTKAGYNKKQGRFIQSPDGTKAITIFQIERKQSVAANPKYSSDLEEIRDISAKIKEKISEIYKVVVLDFNELR